MDEEEKTVDEPIEESKVKKKTKFSIKTKTVIILSIIFLLSIGMNIFLFIKYWKIRKSIDEIVDNRIDKVTETIVDENEKINDEHKDIISKLEEDLKNGETIYVNFEPKTDEKNRKYVTTIVNGNEYRMYLVDDIDKSHKQIVFLAEELNTVTAAYEKENEARNMMIEKLEEELAQAKKDLKTDLTDHQMEVLVGNIKKDMIRFGIDVFLTDTIAISQLLDGKTNINNFGGGVGFNVLVKDKINTRVSLGLQQGVDNNSLNPIVGISIGYYFK